MTTPKHPPVGPLPSRLALVSGCLVSSTPDDMVRIDLITAGGDAATTVLFSPEDALRLAGWITTTAEHAQTQEDLMAHHHIVAEPLPGLRRSVHTTTDGRVQMKFATANRPVLDVTMSPAEAREMAGWLNQAADIVEGKPST